MLNNVHGFSIPIQVCYSNLAHLSKTYRSA